MNRFRGFLRRLAAHPCRGWFLIFFFANILINLDYGTNPRSRFATLCAMVEDHSFRIDHYKHLTIDWAQTPDGHYYSNKAPGPMLLAYPVFWAIDKVITAGKPDRAARDEARRAYEWLTLKILSLLFQTIPFALLVAAGLFWLEGQGVGATALHVACVTMLFGNTASLFMNTYFGHGLAAVCVLALCLCLVCRGPGQLRDCLPSLPQSAPSPQPSPIGWEREKSLARGCHFWNDCYFWAGLTLGLALLSDYGSAVLLPGLLAAVCFQERPGAWARTLIRIAAGGLPPGALWIIYHTICFRGPLTLPSRYQNPEFVDATRNQILGIFNLLPDPANVLQLLFGFRRGLLWSQPWLLVVLAACLVHVRRLRDWRNDHRANTGTKAFHRFPNILSAAPGLRKSLSTRDASAPQAAGTGPEQPVWDAVERVPTSDSANTRLLLFLVPGFFLLLWMNASFGEWHGGSTPGPRYMCAIFPAFGLVVGLLYDRGSLVLRRLLLTTAAAPVVFWIVVYSSTILVPRWASLWPYRTGVLAQRLTDSSVTMICFAALFWSMLWQSVTVCKARETES